MKPASKLLPSKRILTTGSLALLVAATALSAPMASAGLGDALGDAAGPIVQFSFTFPVSADEDGGKGGSPDSVTSCGSTTVSLYIIRLLGPGSCSAWGVLSSPGVTLRFEGLAYQGKVTASIRTASGYASVGCEVGIAASVPILCFPSSSGSLLSGQSFELRGDTAWTLGWVHGVGGQWRVVAES